MGSTPQFRRYFDFLRFWNDLIFRFFWAEGSNIFDPSTRQGRNLHFLRKSRISATSEVALGTTRGRKPWTASLALYRVPCTRRVWVAFLGEKWILVVKTGKITFSQPKIAKSTKISQIWWKLKNSKIFEKIEKFWNFSKNRKIFQKKIFGQKNFRSAISARTKNFFEFLMTYAPPEPGPLNRFSKELGRFELKFGLRWRILHFFLPYYSRLLG